VTIVVILDYMGGPRTDRLYEQVVSWNSHVPVYVLDNASPGNRSRVVTHRNATNSGVGGGICDCIAVAKDTGGSHLLYVANDVEFTSPLYVSAFERVAEADGAVHVGAAVTVDSSQAKLFPWSVAVQSGTRRLVQHVDLLVSLLDLDFIAGFGGFPRSVGGWGYSWELAFHASRRGRPLAVLDSCVVRHADALAPPAAEVQRQLKAAEVSAVYGQKYGRLPWASLRQRVYLAHAQLFAGWPAVAGGRKGSEEGGELR